MHSVLRLACPSSSWPEASAGRRVLRRRANNDGVHALLVAAVVTKNRPEASEHLRDRTAALEADVFRFLPRDAHRAAPLPFIAAGAPRSCRRRDRLMSHCRQDRRRVKAKQALAPTGDALSARKRALPDSLRKGAADGEGLRPSNPGSPRLLRPPYAWPLSTANRHTTKRYKQLLVAASAGRCRG